VCLPYYAGCAIYDGVQDLRSRAEKKERKRMQCVGGSCSWDKGDGEREQAKLADPDHSKLMATAGERSAAPAAAAA